MTRLYAGGAEVDVRGAQTPDQVTTGGTVTRDTTTFRSGAASWKCDSTGSNVAATVTFLSQAPTASRTMYLRAYLNFTAFPTAAISILGIASAGGISVKVTSTGTLQLFRGATQIGSDSVVLSTGRWYRVELSGLMDGTAANFTAAELLLDGVSVATASGFTQARSGQDWFAGWLTVPGASKVMNVDDVAINDSGGSVNNSFPGAGQVILMMPISDNAIGAWVAGAGGTTSLFAAVDNTPPVGVAEASATNTSQIKNRTATNPTSYDGNLATYAAAGIRQHDVINSIQVWDADGEDPATGTKTGAPSMVSNPAIAEPAAINFGNDLGLQGTYLGLWAWHSTAISEAPAVTLTTAPVIRMRCISGATAARSASCCFLGAIVEFSPGSGIAQPCNFASGAMLAVARAWRNRRRSGILVPDLWLPPRPGLVLP